jgi:hypothetical protein
VIPHWVPLLPKVPGVLTAVVVLAAAGAVVAAATTAGADVVYGQKTTTEVYFGLISFGLSSRLQKDFCPPPSRGDLPSHELTAVMVVITSGRV